MQKYLNRTGTIKERDELVEMLSKTVGPGEIYELWREVWVNTDSRDQLPNFDWNQLVKSAERVKRQRRKTRTLRLWLGSSAAVILLMIFFSLNQWFLGEGHVIYETDFGERKEVVLEDGTKVSLNADSKLTWDKGWKKNGKRIVVLEGEAFFEVAKLEQLQVRENGDTEESASERMPFEVWTQDVTIWVLGTAFNAAQRRGKTDVYLEHGSVELSLHNYNEELSETTELSVKEEFSDVSEDENVAIRPKKVIQMHPGDFVSYSSDINDLVLKKMDTSEELFEWKKGLLSYQDESFREVLQNLEDLFGISFKVEDDELLETRVDLTIPYKDWGTVRKMIEKMLDVEILEAEGKVFRIK